MGLDVQAAATEGLDAEDLRRRIDRFRPALLHVHNAYRAGGILLERPLADCWSWFPLVVSPSGTDLNIESKRESGREIVCEVLGRADAIVVQSEEGRERLAESLFGTTDRVHLVPKSFVWLGEDSSDLRGIAGAGPDDILFFMPAGIRPVKGNLECLHAFEKIHRLRPRVRIAFAGPSLDREYAERFRQEVERRKSFACWIPSIAPASMRSAYGAADVILNGSVSEGLSNVLLEGKAAGRPLLASDIPGNRWPVLGSPGDPPMGLLFERSGTDDLVEKALRLIDDGDLRRRLGEAGASYASRMPGPRDEARALIGVYEAATSPAARATCPSAPRPFRAGPPRSEAT
jgi:glycosyltransferase involved in cell wall biosynthesis